MKLIKTFLLISMAIGCVSCRSALQGHKYTLLQTGAVKLALIKIEQFLLIERINKQDISKDVYPGDVMGSLEIPPGPYTLEVKYQYETPRMLTAIVGYQENRNAQGTLQFKAKEGAVYNLRSQLDPDKVYRYFWLEDALTGEIVSGSKPPAELAKKWRGGKTQDKAP
jgi:hypothetical protein